MLTVSLYMSPTADVVQMTKLVTHLHQLCNLVVGVTRDKEVRPGFVYNYVRLDVLPVSFLYAGAKCSRVQCCFKEHRVQLVATRPTRSATLTLLIVSLYVH